MNKQQTASELLTLLQNTQPLFAKAQANMISAKAEYEQDELYLRETKMKLGGLAEGKNAEQREAWVINAHDYKLAAQSAAESRAAFNHAYALYKEQESVMIYIRDMTALLREIQ